MDISQLLHEGAGLSLAVLLSLGALWGAFASCSTSSGFLDAAMPDRLGTGTAFGKGDFSSRSVSKGGMAVDNGSYDENINAIWLEWDIPSFAPEARPSFAGMRDRIVEDYRELRAPEKPKESLISITKSVDEETGEESWSFGVSEALNSALLAVISWLGFRFFRARGGGVGGEEAAEE